jgi:hypothetical protein
MNRRVRRALASEKSKIEKRNADGVHDNDGGPVLTAPNVHYEMAQRTRAIVEGGIGAMHRMVQKLGLAKRIDERLELLKRHKPYHESDHVLNITYNALCGGRTLDDIELRRMNPSTWTRLAQLRSPTRRLPATSAGALRNAICGP